MTDNNPGVVAPVFKKRGKNKNLRKRAATTLRDDSGSSGYSSSQDESGHRVKRRMTKTLVSAGSKNQSSGDGDLSATVFTADRDAPLDGSNDATKQSNWYDKDPHEKAAARARAKDDGVVTASDGTYKGLSSQTSFIQKNPNAPNRKVGPIKAPTNIRTVTVTDFAPDVCKDYKQTGFCGFGDNCKFLHAREDYKQGWQLDREWENVTKGKKNVQGTVVGSADRSRVGGGEDGDDDDDAMLENIPFACIICKGDYREPIMTRCGHYFCEPCALKRYRKEPSCAACGASTNGVFNSAKRLKKLLERKRDRAANKRQAAIEAGEEVDQDAEVAD
ncbi:Pre-mRNA-splicing factor cwc-24 [Zalerion maritima]|uniref:Pre-mRNA-splicing factor CWC24 n=1 Tax=Zalerion maritima TaxID=339359 RepID=A0AAD5S1L2_9PEZI|nr:Pre-mRNA-splicing factor cwc-24 [Zalerion maritima]